MRISDWSSDCALPICTGVIEDLELGKHGLRSVDPDPSYVYLHPDGSSIAIFRDPKRTAEDMARLNRNDGRAYLKFLQVLDAMARSEERSVGKEWVSTCRSRWSRYH